MGGDQLAVQLDATFVGTFEEVDAAQHCTFARAAGTDHAHHIAGAGLERYALEDFVIAEAFVEVFDIQFVHGVLPGQALEKWEKHGPCRSWLAGDEASESSVEFEDAIAGKPAP